ncbi:MAG: cystathionine gamma-synthase [Sphingobacteriia bacterium 24-36-13]|jgi:cystathionine beta-lyase/cystathionine gamma-synthase|uniref:cystathionine gamma-synthase n=1 Tax=Sediminibacterium sp. TaxID=1917865 RepID=UPI000BD8ED03|nr:cystathionine gamma-synthase [Sediminibacterium sp.]OYY11722.1 MAG: cystathionine gamma-synthase [Sphingobacteriia bacterium 35-36-14]OYZ53865.1 MAG: cystathionine gamma-synthase [Sphingobacteriia bacterium 24-36-13]OZA63073.1 MAG: cystathionine gamma-synthase [Sphingobacteriia bacterium 39-36-14]HQS23635.1 cystathionine gamma-synthase [Sediminibacterium sp.]HQS34460.1 cystathionine gamma-synthase [Sediminibacterium sp.]
MKTATKYIHAGAEPDPSTGAIMTPIYQTSTYVQEAPGVNKGFEYARSQNPTRKALEEAYAQIENGQFGLAFGSGVAATDAVIKLLSPGDEVIAANDMYGGTYRLFSKVFEKFGIIFTYVDTTNVANIKAAVSAKTKLIWIETPTNPLMNITDIEAVAAIAKANNVLLCVDNTFASPYLQNPLDLGADIVMHSATKYLGGHSDVIQGALMMNSAELREQLYFIQKSCGAVPGPMDCFLVLRGIKTLHLRMQRHCENGRAIAHWLRKHPKVGKVYWCGFEDHPNYAIARKQMRDFGGMLSFELKDDSMDAAKKVLSSTKLFSLAESLGGVESLINHPASMTHASIPREKRIANGLSDTLIRLSIGVEDADDLIGDLEKALA